MQNNTNTPADQKSKISEDVIEQLWSRASLEAPAGKMHVWFAKEVEKLALATNS